MKDHERAMLEQRGLLISPEFDVDVEEALRWFYQTLKLREVDFSSGLYKSFTPIVINDLCRAEYTRLSDDYLYTIAPALDYEYTRHIQKTRSEE